MPSVTPASPATKTQHSASCARVFNRYDPSCPRCVELMAGASARPGWSDNKRAAEAMRCEAIRRHFAPGSTHSLGACGPVCTFGDW